MTAYYLRNSQIMCSPNVSVDYESLKSNIKNPQSGIHEGHVYRKTKTILNVTLTLHSHESNKSQ